tara:strand:+ start:93728 stop:93925 length:198 start_codon:yes stop_codon:yes gene_type:complete
LKSLFLSVLLATSIGYASELTNEDEEIVKDLEFFSNLELLEDEVSLEELEEMEALVTEEKKGEQS